MTRALILGAHPPTLARLRDITEVEIVGVDADVVELHRRPDEMRRLLMHGGEVVPDIVLLGDALPVEEALALSGVVSEALIGVEIILISTHDPELALRAMRAGVRDVIAPDASLDDLSRIMKRATENVTNRHNALGEVPEEFQPVEKSTVTVIVAPKGGVGKTTISTNLAIALAKSHPLKTVIVDLDSQFGDVATHLDLRPAHSLADAVTSHASTDSLILKTFLTAHSAGFHVLAADPSPTTADLISSDHVHQLIAQLSQQFRHVIVDTGAGLGDHTLGALEAADSVVFVTSLDVSSVRALRMELDLLNELNLVPADARLVVNLSDRDSGLTAKDVESAVGLPVAAVIPRSSEVVLAGNRGEPLLLQPKLSQVGKALKNLADQIDTDPVSAGDKRGLFGRSKPKALKAPKPSRAPKEKKGARRA